ncbi:MAG: Cys-tRNA(Pro) deacylase, partial [Turicibacter sp.]|nr:Cys-tRNA(Pro) deacylase [Turicibacter sp.]
MANVKTNAMRLLDKHKITYQILSYQTKEALDGVLVASKIGRNQEEVFKTLVTRGQSKEIYVFVLPV